MSSRQESRRERVPESRSGFDRHNPRHWTTTDHYSGITPLGLSQWLQDTPEPQWPTSYTELNAIGLGVWITDWLELGLPETGGATLTEVQVIRVFLFLLEQPEVFHALNHEQAVNDAFAQVLLCFAGKSAAFAGLDGSLLLSLTTGLRGLEAGEWPAQLFGLESVDLVANGS